MLKFRKGWASASPLLSPLIPLDHGPPCATKVLQLTLDRACLLAELPDRALLRLDFEFPGTLDALHSARGLAVSLGHLTDDPHRFLYPVVTALSYDYRLTWSQFCDASRQATWAELLAMQGPISAAGLTVSIEQFFEEDKFVDSAIWRAMELFSFKDRCMHSDCANLLPRISAGGHDDAPSWEDPPRKRI